MCSWCAQKCMQIHAKLPWTLSTTKWELKSPQFFFLKFSSTNLIKICSTALELLFGYRDGKMGIAVVRVTPKQCKVIKSLKKKIHVLNNIFKNKKKTKKWLHRLRHSKVRNKWATELQVPHHRSVEKAEDNNIAYIRVSTKYKDIHKVLAWGTILSRILLEHFLLFILMKPTICTYKTPICPITIQCFLARVLVVDCCLRTVTPVFKTS